MDSLIIGISGKAHSGKNTLANYLAGLILKKFNLINWFTYMNGLRVYTTSYLLVDWLNGCGIDTISGVKQDIPQILKIVKVYDESDYLKDILSAGLKIPRRLFDTKKYLPVNVGEYGDMELRELMIRFGMEMRRYNEDFWFNVVISRIREDNPRIAIYSGVRFINVANHLKRMDAKLIRLTRNVLSGLSGKYTNDSETNLDRYDKFDLVIDNADLHANFDAVFDKYQPQIDELLDSYITL